MSDIPNNTFLNKAFSITDFQELEKLASLYPHGTNILSETNSNQGGNLFARYIFYTIAASIFLVIIILGIKWLLGKD